MEFNPDTVEVKQLLSDMSVALEKHMQQQGIVDPLMVGIHTGGVWIAEYLHQALGFTSPLSTLDISFYRDDFTRVGLNPKVKPSSMPLATEGQHIILVDDVVMSGRTVRAALNELFDYGRPASVTLVSLLDLSAHELPIRPDVTAMTVTLPAGHRIKLTGPEPLKLELQAVNVDE